MSEGITDHHAGGSQAAQAFLVALREQLQRPSARRSDPWSPAPLVLVPLASFAGAFLGCVATLHLCTFGLPPSLASAAATLFVCAVLIAAPAKNLVPTTLSSSAYGGSFSGMTPIVTLNESVAHSGLPVDKSFLLLSIFCGLVFCAVCVIELRLGRVLLRGYGGRFGALAALGSFLFLSLGPLLGADGVPFGVGRLDVFDKGLVGSLVIFALCATGMSATLIALRQPRVAASGRAMRIFVSAAVAFIGLAILQYVQPDDACLAEAYYAGCFLGMSAPARLRGSVQPVIAAAALTILLVEASAILPAVGGSLGLAAFLTVAGADVASRLFDAAGPFQSPARGALVAAFVVAGMLLVPREVFRDRPMDDTTGSTPTVDTPLPAVAVRLEQPSGESAKQAVPSAAPDEVKPAAGPWPDLALPVRPARAALPARRPAEVARGATQPPATRPLPRSSIRSVQPPAATTSSVPVRRSQARAVPRPVPRPRAVTQQDVVPLQESQQTYPSYVPPH